MLLATFCFSIMQSLVKSLTEIHTFEIFFIRGLITTIFCISYLLYYKIPMLGSQHKLLLLRAVTGVVSTCIFYFTLKWMPFGAAVSLKYLSPIFAAIFAIFLVNEKMRPIQWFFFTLSLVGIFLLKGFDSRIEVLPLILALVAAVIGGISFTFIRQIGSKDHSMVIVNYYMFVTAVSMGLLSIPFWTNPSAQDWLALVVLSITGFIGQILMTKAMQLEAVNRMAPLKYMELVYALLIGLFWFGESYVFLSFLGIVLIISGMLLNVVYGKRS